MTTPGGTAYHSQAQTAITSKYKHQGIQGEMLEEIHDILRSTIPDHVELVPCGNVQADSIALHVETTPTRHD